MRRVLAAAAMAACMHSPAIAQDPVVLDIGGIVKAMDEISKFSRQPFSDWRAIQEDAWQGDLLAAAPLIRQEIQKVPEMTGYASRHHQELNDKLAAAKSPIRLRPWDPANGYGAVSILGYAAEWTTQGIYQEKAKDGTVTPVTVLGKPAFKMLLHMHDVSIINTGLRMPPIVDIMTKSDDRILFQRLDKSPADGFSLYAEAQKIIVAAAQGEIAHGYVGAIIPMVNLNVGVPEIEKMVGMKLGGDFVAQALQNVRFYLDPNGAKVETETAIRVGRSPGGPRYVVLDGPFMVVVSRSNLRVPIFVGYITPSVFGAPPTWKPKS